MFVLPVVVKVFFIDQKFEILKISLAVHRLSNFNDERLDLGHSVIFRIDKYYII